MDTSYNCEQSQTKAWKSTFVVVIASWLMGKDFQSSPHRWQSVGQFPNANSSKLPFNLGMQNPDIPCAIPCTDAVPPNFALPAFGMSGLPDLKPGQMKEPHGWFYCLPRFRQGLIPDMTLHEKLLPQSDLPGMVSEAVNENFREANTSIAGGGHTQKQFLVFDQTGSKTTMVFSSGIGAPIQGLNSWSQKPTGYCNMSGNELGIGSNGCYHSGPNLTDEFDDYHVTNEESEMREDTEEINALLYSDDEDNYSEDGEETSTGHSPSTMTAYEKQDWFEEEDTDEVASSAGPTKRQKLSNSGHEVPSVTNASSSNKPNRSWEYEDDAESSCAGGIPMRCSDTGSLSGNKRLRQDKIRETVSILQTIIPGGRGKDPVVVLDEAINYLRSLKFKAKSLGVSAL